MIGPITSIWNAVPEAYNTIKSGANKTLDFIQNTVPPNTTIGFSGMNLNPVDAAITLDSTPVFKVNDGSVMTMAPEGVYESGYFDNPYDSVYGSVGDVQGFGDELDGVSSLGPIKIGLNNYDPSTFADDTSPMNEAASYPNYYEQVNPAGVTSADGMMTEPAMYLYPGEKIGIDGVPYRPSAGASTSNSGSNSGGGNTAVTSAIPSAPVLKTRTFPFTSRTPSGTVYAPDLSAYNDSSLFNYAGPGGLAEYTYGQGLRTDGADYSIFGSPANIANPYFSGQFKQPQGPADAAINMPAVELPEGVQPVTPTEVSADVSMPGFVGGMLPGGITPRPPSVGTVFPSPGVGPTLTQSMIEDAAINVDRINAMDNQLQNQINTNRVISNIAGAPAMDDTANIERGMLTSQRGTTMDDTADIERGMLTSQRGTTMDDTADIEAGMSPVVPTTQQQMDLLQARANEVYNNMTAEEKRDGLFIEPVYSVSKDTMKLGIPDIFATNNENVSSTGNLINRTPPERSLFKPDEIDIPTPPFRPEGVEGVDFYQDVTGNYFAMEDDLGTQPLGPNTRGSRRNETLFSEGPNVRGSRRNPTLFSEGPSVRGTRGDTVPADIPDFLDYDITRDNANYEDAVNARDAQLSNQLDSRPAYERDRMEYLDNAYSAIDAKYAGSETNASQQAELVEVLNANLDSFGNAAGRENAALAREQQDMRQTNVTPFIPSYAREIEGTDMGESLFQGVDTSPTNTVYPGENSIPFNPSNPIDQLVLQKTAQEAQVARAKYDNVPARAETGGTPISIFNVPAREPVSMNQVRPMVARTENNMTVPVMRDSALDRRYGGPMRFGR